jgi:hypothetical protein
MTTYTVKFTGDEIKDLAADTRGRPVTLVYVRYVAGLVLLGLFGWVAIWNLAPAVLVYRAGSRPVNESYRHSCPLDEPGLENCSTTTAFRWQLSGGGARADTRMAFSRSDTTAVRGHLAQTGCPESRVDWTLTAGGRMITGTLTGAQNAMDVTLPVEDPASGVSLSLYRWDSAQCVSEFQWQNPLVARPGVSLPWDLS